jgi:hypothetical protein
MILKLRPSGSGASAVRCFLLLSASDLLRVCRWNCRGLASARYFCTSTSAPSLLHVRFQAFAAIF